MADTVLQCLSAMLITMTSAILTLHTINKVPSRPGQINMHESQLLTTHVDLSWEASTGYLDSYLVMLKNCAGDVVAKKSTKSTWPTILLDNPLTGTAYEVVIWAVAGGTLGPPMTSKIQVEESNLRIRNLIEKKRGTTYVLLEWTSPLYNSVENYEVQWHPVHSKSVEILKVDPDETSLYIKDLNPGQLFTFIVTSVFPSQCEDKVRVQSEDIQVRTLPSRPGQINMHESQLQKTHVDLSWEASTGYVDSYLVILENCAGDVVAKKSTESTWLTLLLDNPLTGTAYEVVIWAVAGGTLSPPMTSKIQVEESNLRIRNLIAKKRGTTYVLLEWTSPLYNSVENYEVQWHPVHSKSVEILKVDPDETSLYIKDLNPGQLFTFIVTSVFSSQCEDKVRVQSEDIQVRTLEEPQQPPFIDEQGSKTKSTSIELKTVKTFNDVMKYIIVRERNDNSLVLYLESRDDTVLVNEDIDINTNYLIEIYVKSKGIRSVSQFLHVKTKDVQVSMPCLIGGIVGGTIAIGSLTLLGFGPGGIVGGTMAAWLMSFGKTAGSLFAILQSVGVVGLSVSVKATFIAVGIAAGCMIEVT